MFNTFFVISRVFSRGGTKIKKVIEEAKTDETLRIELQDELEQLKSDQQKLIVIFAARGPEEGATPLAQASFHYANRSAADPLLFSTVHGGSGVDLCTPLGKTENPRYVVEEA